MKQSRLQKIRTDLTIATDMLNHLEYIFKDTDLSSNIKIIKNSLYSIEKEIEDEDCQNNEWNDDEPDGTWNDQKPDGKWE